jgi:Copper transport outer membrane protein, MctB
VIDFRYHLVSIVAVFLALAVGIVLGSTMLREPISRNLDEQVSALTEDKEQLRAQVRDLEARIEYDDALIDEVAPSLVSGRLAGESVVIVSLPGAQSETVDAVAESVEQSGAAVTGRINVQPAFVDPEQTSVLDALVARVPPPGLDLSSDATPTPYDRAAAVLADALVTSDLGAIGEEYQPGSTVLLALTEGGFVDVDGTPSQRAGLAVIVGGSAPERVTEQTDADNDALVRLTGQLDARGRGSVAGGPPTASTEGGYLAAVVNGGERSEGVSTVNTANAASGRLTVNLALVEQLAGGAGNYGYGEGTDAPLPQVPVTAP